MPARGKRKTAMDQLLDTVKQLIDDGAKEMSPEQLRESERKFNEIIDRATAARQQRRETA